MKADSAKRQKEVFPRQPLRKCAVQALVKAGILAKDAGGREPEYFAAFWDEFSEDLEKEQTDRIRWLRNELDRVILMLIFLSVALFFSVFLNIFLALPPG